MASKSNHENGKYNFGKIQTNMGCRGPKVVIKRVCTVTIYNYVSEYVINMIERE